MKTLFEGKKLYAVIIAFLFIITFLITFHIIRNKYEYVLKNTIAENKLMAHLLSSLMYEHQKAAIGILESYAQRSLFIDAVKKKDFHHVIPHLKSLSKQHTEIDALVLYDQHGTIWANYPVSKEGFGKNFAYRDLYKGVSKKWRPYISTLYRRVAQGKKLAVAVSVPVFDRKGKVIGVLCGTQHASLFATLIKENILDPERGSALLDHEGNIIFSNAVPYQEKITKYPDAHVLEKAVAGVLTDVEIADAKEKGSISYVSIAPVRGIGWSVIVGQEKNAILKSLYGYFISYAIAGFVIFLFLTVSLLYFRREYKYRKTKELLQAEEKYRNIFNDAILGIYQTTPEGRFIIINPVFAAICGYASPEEMIEKVTDIPNQLYANPEDRLRLQKRIAAEAKVKGFEVQFKHPTQGLVWVSINANALRDEQGNIRNYDGTIEGITERKHAEEALQASEEKYHNIFNDAILGIYQTTPEGRILSANPALARMYGYDTPEELTNNVTATQMYVNPEDREIFKRNLLREGVVEKFETRFRKKGGETIWVSINAHTVKDTQGNISSYEGTIENITERKRAEEELDKEREKFSTLSENAPFGMVMILKDGTFSYMNPKFRDLFGYTLDEIPDGRTWFRKAYPDASYRHKVISQWINDLKDIGAGEQLPRIFTVKRKDGSTKIINFIPVLLATGDNMIACEDITDRKRAEEELWESENNFRRSLEDSPLGVHIVTIEGETVYANRAMLNIYGYDSIEELRTAPVKKRYTPESYAEFQIRMEKRRQGEYDPSEYEVNIVRENGEVRHLLVFRKEVLWNGERQFQTVYQDITERKQAEEEQERLLAEIAAKNQELESFVYTISHDLRAPLVSIDGFYSLLKRESQDQLGEQGQHYLERIRANVAHMNTLVTELLELSRIGLVVGPEEEIDVGVLVREIEEGLLLKLKQEGVEFIVQQPLPAVRGDRGRIRQVFANLIENAVKFRSLERGLRIEVGCEEERGFYRFHVRDNGIGILPQYQEQIFEPFRQLDRGIEGVGMGLTLVKRIVEHHGGRLWVESKLGKGSTFYFTIPDRT